MSEKRYCFEVEWYDPQAAVVRKYSLYFFTFDSTIEIVQAPNLLQSDRQTKFLRRTASEVRLKDLYPGNVLAIYAKQFRVVGYGDEFTRKEVQPLFQRTYGMIKPNAYLAIGAIVSAVEASPLSLTNIKMFRFSREQAETFYAEHRGKPFFETLVAFMTSDFCVGMELVGQNAIQEWRTLIGPTNSLVAKEKAPNSIRARFGVDGTQNAVHGSDSPESAARELSFIFSSAVKNSPMLTNCSLCLIKPHILAERKAGQVIDFLLKAGFELSCLQMLWPDKQANIQFFEAYKGVLPEVTEVIEHMSKGPCIAMELRQEECVEVLRSVVGPYDPQIARALRKDTLRARLGKDRVRNAVHVTDLPEDGALEVNYYLQELLRR